MRFKIDTKADYRILTICEPILNANMSAEFELMIFQNDPQAATSLIMDLSQVEEMNEQAMKGILAINVTLYANNASCVIAGLDKTLQTSLQFLAGGQQLNLIPTVSEAVDLVMMEGLERILSGSVES